MYLEWVVYLVHHDCPSRYLLTNLDSGQETEADGKELMGNGLRVLIADRCAFTILTYSSSN